MLDVLEKPDTAGVGTDDDNLVHIVCCDDMMQGLCGVKDIDEWVDHVTPEEQCVVCVEMNNSMAYFEHLPGCPNFKGE